MASRISKDVSSKLWKFVSKVDVKFNPFDQRTKSAREFLNQAKSSRLSKSNPKLEVKVTVLNTPDAPVVYMTFIDGSTIQFDSQIMKAAEMLEEVHMRTSDMSFQYEMDGKNVDDL